jgi:Predicted rRNA methylase (SpoU class)
MINIVLYEPEIPANTGNIMRTCAGTNTKLHLIKPLGFSLEEKYLKRSSANYLEECDMEIYENFEEFKKQNKGTYYYLTRYGTKPHTSFDYSDHKENIYFVLGKESSGIPKEILKDELDHCMRMPMTEKIRALNLSNTAAIIVYEALRQQEYKNLLFEDPFKENYLNK